MLKMVRIDMMKFYLSKEAEVRRVDDEMSSRLRRRLKPEA